jgi:RNA polymerase sigma factor (sigma-70 family)
VSERGDAELVREALTGGQEAFGALVERYKDAVFGAAFHRLGNFEEARDAAQETFVKAFRNLGKLKRPGAFGNWLYRIAAGTALDAARKRRAEVSLEDIGEVGEITESGEDVMAGKAWAALETLPEATRLAVILHYVDGYSHAQVAQFLGATEGAVKTRVSRGRAKLREEMAAMVKGRLKQESPVFIIEATDDSGRWITGSGQRAELVRMRGRLLRSGYRIVRFERDTRTEEERQAEHQEAIRRVASTVLTEALKQSASRVRIALPRAGVEKQMRVSYLVGETWHEVMSMPTYVWEPLRRRLAEMAGVELREEAARQRGRIRFEFEGRERELGVAFGRRVVRLEVK